jgi:hypothetical protein
MKYVKTLILAAVAVAALLAFLGAGTASATVLCKTEPNGGATGTKGTTCPEGWAYPANTEIHGVLDPGTVTKTKTTFANAECKKSTFRGKTNNEGSANETVTVNLEVLTFEECNCEYKVLNPGTLEIHWIPDTFNGTVTSNGMEKTVTCNTIFGPVHCIYVTVNTDIGTLTGGNPATLDVDATMPRLPTDAICAEQHTWEAKYEITTPKPLYVAAET